MSLRSRPSLTGYVEPCQPITAPDPPSGPGWIHEIKHDGFRLMARRDAGGIRLITRGGHDWSDRYVAVRTAVYFLPCKRA
jgi:bifunctional non-homologous end joining protein LigD